MRLSAIYSYARRHVGFNGLCPTADLNRSERPKDDADEARALTPAELRRLIDAASPGDKLMCEFARDTGMRQSEVIGLMWDDVEDGAVFVSEQLSRGKAGERTRVDLKNSTKAHAKRRVILPDEWTKKLAAHKLAQRPGCPWVFPNGRGQARAQSNVIRAFKATVNRAGIDPKTTMHWLRHTHGSALISIGTDVATVAARLGDSVEVVQSTYLHEFNAAEREAQQRESLAALMAAFDGSKEQQNPPATGTEGR